MTGYFKKVFIGSNLKMYKTNQQNRAFVSQLLELTKDLTGSNLILFILPSYTALADICRLVDHSSILIGAQNMHWEDNGAYTGEISPLMLKELGIDLVMLGHAERRSIFGETDRMVNQRVKASLSNGFRTLLCVGDTAEDMFFGVSEERLRLQIKIALHGVESSFLEQLWVAYEPVWAIGAGGKPADPEFASRMQHSIRNTLNEVFPDHPNSIPILYGGSVNFENCSALISQPEIDGLFIGRAAWDAVNFNRIIRKVIQTIDNQDF